MNLFFRYWLFREGHHGDTSFDVLGLERGDKSQSEVLAVLAEYKDAGNMTEELNTQVQKLAVDTQVCNSEYC